MKRFLGLMNKTKSQEAVIIVSGLPRSGTSMMMKMLDAGGIPPFTDNLRTPDEDNPKGYYEYERVKKLPEGDTEWLKEAKGKAVKVISALLEHLPDEYQYKILFMRRNMDEILASQRQMLIRSGKPTDKVSDEQMAALYHKHLAKVETWLQEKPNMSVLYVDYNAMLKDARPHLEQINRFLDNCLDIEKMAQVIDPNLYRQRNEGR